jgi:hypothetical protein
MLWPETLSMLAVFVLEPMKEVDYVIPGKIATQLFLPLQVQAQESDSYSASFAVCSVRQESVLPVSERQHMFMWARLQLDGLYEQSRLIFYSSTPIWCWRSIR